MPGIVALILVGPFHIKGIKADRVDARAGAVGFIGLKHMRFRDANLARGFGGFGHAVDIHLEGQNFIVEALDIAGVQHAVQPQAVGGDRIGQRCQRFGQVFGGQHKEPRLAAIG
ncbi:MAG: hypothetical protein ACD_10C00898G0001 [uncultured bacterium]|nr:MAG: hypothetical protein ACD_10C00898G0001 [uncultured bacterium]